MESHVFQTTQKSDSYFMIAEIDIFSVKPGDRDGLPVSRRPLISCQPRFETSGRFF